MKLGKKIEIAVGNLPGYINTVYLPEGMTAGAILKRLCISPPDRYHEVRVNGKDATLETRVTAATPSRGKSKAIVIIVHKMWAHGGSAR